MRPLEINLARRPYRNDLPIAVLLGTLVVATLLFTISNVYTWVTADSRLAELERMMRDYESEMQAMEQEARTLEEELRGVDLDVVAPQADFVDAVLAERNFSWTLLFNSLEEVLPWDVRLTIIRPRFELGKVIVNVHGIARSYEGYLSFQRALQSSPYFDEVVPTGYETGRLTDNRLVFALEFVYEADSRLSEPGGEDTDTPAGDPQVIVVDGEEARGLEAADGSASGTVAPGAARQAASANDEGETVGSRRSATAVRGADARDGARDGERRGGRRGPSRRANADRGAGEGSSPGGASGEDAGSAMIAPAAPGAAAPRSAGARRGAARPAAGGGAGGATTPTRSAGAAAEDEGRRRIDPENDPRASREDLQRPSGGMMQFDTPARDPNAPDPGNPRDWKPGQGEKPAGEGGEGGSSGGSEEGGSSGGSGEGGKSS